MKYLLDTCIIIEHLRGKKPISTIWLEGGCAISIITYAELLYGAERSQRPDHQKKLVSQLLEDLRVEVINIDQKIVSVFAKQRAALAKSGNTVDHFDSLIAATAIRHQLTLATYNLKHFNRFVDLAVVDQVVVQS